MMGLFAKKKTEKKQGAEYIVQKAEDTGALKKTFLRLPIGDGSRFRIIIGAVFFCILWTVLWCRSFYLQVIAAPELAQRAAEQHEFTEHIHGRRGIITDRNGQVIARSVEAQSVYASPGKIRDPRVVANTLGPILNIEPKDIHARLTKTKRHFIWLKRKVDDKTASQIESLHLPGIGLKAEYTRVYPFKHMAGQLIGFVNTDGKGLEGLEHTLDSRLSSPAVEQVVLRDARGKRFSYDGSDQLKSGENIRLTLDMHVQYIAEEALAKSVLEYNARWGGAIVVDVKNGDILAWAQYPFFNPNSYSEYGTLIYRNRLAQDALEPGSTFKPLVMALALQDRKVTPDTLINCEGGRWRGKNFSIRDTSIQGTISASKVLRYSSNIGMAKIGLSIGNRRFYSYLQNLGFGHRSHLPLVENRGIVHSLHDWNQVDTIATSFGQSISVTGLQMAQAYLTLLNDGVFKPIRLIDEDIPVENRPRSFSAKTAAQVKSMMRDVVEAKDGTGKRARIPGIEVGGKTGTAQKADRRSKTYGSKRLASFVGFLPASHPEFLILVMIDEPTKNQFGGVVSAPVFSEIGAKLMAYTGRMSVAAATSPKASPEEEEEPVKPKRRPLKLAGLTPPWESRNEEERMRKTNEMDLPGKLAKAAKYVPDVKGKSLRNAVELFARGGVVPEIKGSGNLVVRQVPPPGSKWPEEGDGKCILWLSEK